VAELQFQGRTSAVTQVCNKTMAGGARIHRAHVELRAGAFGSSMVWVADEAEALFRASAQKKALDGVVQGFLIWA